jgi:hypothetical protein
MTDHDLLHHLPPQSADRLGFATALRGTQHLRVTGARSITHLAVLTYPHLRSANQP